MANYCCAIRTNYFRVKDPEAFKNFMGKVYACEDEIEVWEEVDRDNKLVFGFGCYSGISGLAVDDDECETDYDAFIEGLQKHVADDDAVIIFEAGNEKLRYVIGSATIVTSRDYEYIDIVGEGTKLAAELLGNPKWKTRADY